MNSARPSQASRSSTTFARRCVVELVHAEAHRNERRINTVKMWLVALGIVMSLTFRLQAGEEAAQVAYAQSAVLGVWLVVMVGVWFLVRGDCMHRGVPYLVLTADMIAIASLVVVRMLWMPAANQVKDGVLAEWVFVMLFPVLASAGPRFDRDVARFAELWATVTTLGLLVFDIAVLGSQPRPFFVLITLVALLATGRFAVMVSDRGRALIEGAARWGAKHGGARGETWQG